MDPQTSPVSGSPTLGRVLVSAAPDSLDTAITAAQAASDKLAADIVAIDVSEQLVITDVFVICSGANERQVKSIVDAIEEALHAKGVKPIRREGVKGAHWVLLDFGDVVVHVQQAEDRVHYAIERLWKDCPVVELPESVTSGQIAPSE
ncbi:MAG: ribosome silencing factor [Actinobacteria bacterium]|nr:ribosome silencing factor [Actinomycetota bacterium]NDH19619.1 ribosome silencing factor [Actinomycetota bacterium]